MDDNVGVTFPIYNMDVGNGNYITYLRYDITVEEEQTVNINYDVNTTGMFAIASDPNDPELILTSPGQTSGNVKITLKEGSNSVYIVMQGSIDDSFSTSLDGQPYCSICGHIHKYTSEITKKVTKTEKGEKTYTCECGDEYIKELEINLENLSWDIIAEISEDGEAKEYFNIGDTKKMTLSNGETYNAEIIGFNHDNLADGSGKVGITFQFKELMNTGYIMNTAQTNVGGWEASEMRDYLNDEEDINSVYNLLPSDLQAEIKEVSKVSDVGNRNTTDKVTTTDKLFLLSLEEVGLSHSYNVTGQGTKYEIYSDNASRIKYLSGSIAFWWLRSADTSSTTSFFNVYSDGSYDSSSAYYPYGVAPAFCI